MIGFLSPIAGSAEIVDLTHTLRNGMPVWKEHPKFEMAAVSSLEQGDVATVHSLCLSEHTGTHFDAPCHFIEGARSIDRVPPKRFFGRLATISAESLPDRTELGADAIERFEAEHGQLRAGDAVAFSFGWARFWEHPTEAERFSRDWPGLSRQAAELLAARGVSLVATDCMSIDRFGTPDYAVHKCLLQADILIGENFANLHALPAWSELIATPLPILGGTGSPVRALALLDKPSSGARGKR